MLLNDPKVFLTGLYSLIYAAEVLEFELLRFIDVKILWAVSESKIALSNYNAPIPLLMAELF